MAAHQGAQIVMVDEGKLGRDQRTQAVIHHRQMQALKVGDVAADVERQDLALALIGEAVAAGEALDDEAALGRGVALADDVLVGRNGFQPQRQTQQGGLLLRHKRSDALQLADQREGVRVNAIQDSLPWSSGGSTRPSQPPAPKARMPAMP